MVNDIGNLFKIADYETKRGNHKKAIESYRQILKLSAPDSKAQHLSHWGIGDLYLNNKQYDKAEYHLKQALRLKQDEPIYHYLLGCTYTYMNKIDDAIIHLEKATTLDSSQDIYWGQLGWVVGYNRDTEKGIKYLKKALTINPCHSKSLQDICILYTKKHKWGEALVCIEEALKHEPSNKDIARIKEDVEFFRSEFERLSQNGTAKQND